MASWMIFVHRPADPLEGPGDPRIAGWHSDGQTPETTGVASWKRSAGPFAWADSLVAQGRASVTGDGFPLLYAAQAGDIAAGENQPDLIGHAGLEEWLILEAWDQD